MGQDSEFYDFDQEIYYGEDYNIWEENQIFLDDMWERCYDDECLDEFDEGGDYYD